MKKLIIILTLIISLPFLCLSQRKTKKTKIVTIKGSWQIELLNTMSRAEAEEQVTNLAIINALENEFGKVVIQGNSTYVKNNTDGEKIQSQTSFNMIANTTVAGEVVEVLEKNFEDIESFDDNKTKRIDIKCTVKIKARKKIKTPIEFEAFPLGCTDKKCKTTEFKNYDDFYMYFKSPISGYLTIFLDDSEESYRLLPYQNTNSKYEGGMPIKADKEYYLFSTDPKYNYDHNPDFEEDTYQLTTEGIKDLNRLFIIFSKSPLNKPSLEKNINKESLSDKTIEQGFSIPSSLSSEKFQKWLIKNNSIRNDMQIMPIDISITK